MACVYGRQATEPRTPFADLGAELGRERGLQVGKNGARFSVGRVIHQFSDAAISWANAAIPAAVGCRGAAGFAGMTPSR